MGIIVFIVFGYPGQKNFIRTVGVYSHRKIQFCIVVGRHGVPCPYFMNKHSFSPQASNIVCRPSVSSRARLETGTIPSSSRASFAWRSACKRMIVRGQEPSTIWRPSVNSRALTVYQRFQRQDALQETGEYKCCYPGPPRNAIRTVEVYSHRKIQFCIAVRVRHAVPLQGR